jgi:hypothetical protein
MKELQTGKKNKMALLRNYLSIITSNVNGLNSLIKGHRMTEKIKNKTQLFAARKKLTSPMTYTARK